MGAKKKEVGCLGIASFGGWGLVVASGCRFVTERCGSGGGDDGGGSSELFALARTLTLVWRGSGRSKQAGGCRQAGAGSGCGTVGLASQVRAYCVVDT